MATNGLVLRGGRTQPREQPNPWETAKRRFLEGLDPAERKLFDEATPENLLYSTSNAEKADSRDSKTRAILDKLRPLILTIQDYGKAMDVYVQIEPLYMSSIWGSLRVLLIMASTHMKFYTRMIDALGQIAELLPRFRMNAIPELYVQVY
jgi:hypothetical protein